MGAPNNEKHWGHERFAVPAKGGHAKMQRACDRADRALGYRPVGGMTDWACTEVVSRRGGLRLRGACNPVPGRAPAGTVDRVGTRWHTQAFKVVFAGDREARWNWAT